MQIMGNGAIQRGHPSVKTYRHCHVRRPLRLRKAIFNDNSMDGKKCGRKTAEKRTAIKMSMGPCRDTRMRVSNFQRMLVIQKSIQIDTESSCRGHSPYCLLNALNVTFNMNFVLFSFIFFFTSGIISISTMSHAFFFLILLQLRLRNRTLKARSIISNSFWDNYHIMPYSIVMACGL